MQPAEPPPVVIESNVGDAGTQAAPPQAARPSPEVTPTPEAPAAPAAPSATAAPAAPVAPASPVVARPLVSEPEAPLVALKPEYERPTIELGAGAFLMVGGGAGSYAGVTPFLVDEVSHGVFLRPSIEVGTTLATNVSSTFVSGRFDTCARLPGRYAARNGIQLDLCGGPEAGASFIAAGTLPGNPPSDKTLPYVNLGPSLDLHGEIDRLAVLLRGVFGVNIAKESFTDVTGTQVEAQAIAWRLELDFSWAVQQ
jgi:hypothetical protein